MKIETNHLEGMKETKKMKKIEKEEKGRGGRKAWPKYITYLY